MDPRLRFGNKRFQSRLKTARGFRRNYSSPTENKFLIILKALGLNTFLKQLVAIFVVLIFGLVVYFPNWFYVRTINIQGAGDIEQNVREATTNYFSLHKFWPQQNLLLLKKPNLSEYLEKNLTGILRVEKIQKKIFHTLNIQVIRRENKYLVQSLQGTYLISNDNKIHSEILEPISATSSLNSLLKLKINILNKPSVGETLVSQEMENAFVFIQNPLANIVKKTIDHIEIGNITIPEIGVIYSNNFKIYLNYKQNLEETEKRLHLLLEEPTNSDLNKISYIDLRFSDKGYVCLKTAICHNNQPVLFINPTQASSTPVN
jgi:hypothetical protein